MKKTLILTMLVAILISCIPQQTAETTEVVVIKETLQNQTKSDECLRMNVFTERDLCYNKRAETEVDYTLCKEISDPTMSIECYTAVADISKNPNICVNINVDYQRDICYLNIASKQNNPVLCGAMIYHEVRNDCYDSINFTVLDKKICGQIQIKENRAECIAKFESGGQ